MDKGELVRSRREALGISQAELGRRIGAPGRPVSQATIDKIESGQTRRSRFFPEIARELAIELSELDPAFVRPNDVIPAEALLGRKDLPIYASAEGGEGSLIIDYDPVEYVKRPYMLESVRGGYGIIVTGESMVPVVRPGDIVLVHPHMPPRIDDVVVLFQSFLSDTKATVKEYRGQTEDAWRLRRYCPKLEDFTLDKDEWQECHATVGRYSRR